MYIVTNRAVRAKKTGFKAFGDKPNPRGPHELRFVEVSESTDGYDVKVLDDTLSREEKEQLGVPVSKVAYRSKFVAKKLFEKVNQGDRNLLIFVHGFNNNVRAVVERAFHLQREFNVEVLPFSWPAKGGGASGALSYKSDKKDARASIGALDRVLDLMRERLQNLREAELTKIRDDANRRFSRDAETKDEFLARAFQKDCSYRVSLLAHSMGNYLFKQLLKSSLYSANELLFDNVVLVAADTNNKDHKDWIDTVSFRSRLYVTINEADSALKLSRMKGGDEQLARLGHFPYELNANRAVYANFTGAQHVGDSHAYFEGDPLENEAVRRFFTAALNGDVAEGDLDYNVFRNIYDFPEKFR